MNRYLVLLPLIALVVGLGLMVGCEDSDSGSDVAGTATIQGNVSDFALQGSSVAAGLVKAGVTVKIKGTDFEAVTADDGTFVISGVPAGNYVLVIKYGDAEVEYPLGDVADDSRVEITNIEVTSTGSIVVEKLQVVDLSSNKVETKVQDDDEPEEAVPAGTIKVNVSRGDVG